MAEKNKGENWMMNPYDTYVKIYVAVDSSSNCKPIRFRHNAHGMMKHKKFMQKENKNFCTFLQKHSCEHKLHVCVCLIAIICWICALSLVNKTIGVQMFLNDSVSLSLNIYVCTRFCLFARFLHTNWFCYCWFPASVGCSLWK